MNSELLLTTKLYIPPARPEWMPRPRLVERLDAGLHRKLTLISAPAGFGKTTLLSEWVAARDPSAAWISLDEGDNDPARFLVYFVAALRTVEESIGEGTLAALQSPQPPPLEELLTALINQINAIPGAGDGPRSAGPRRPGPQGRFILILDDYHVITAQPIHDALTFLLDHLPGNMHLVIATRADPPLPIARLRGRGQLTELRLSDLRFTLNEMAVFLMEVMGLALTADDVAALASRTEGWIAGLQMAALALHSAASMQRQEDIARFIQAFTGSDRHILDYLVEEVLQYQPPDVQAFLLQTSILDQLSGPLCDAVTGDQPVSTPADQRAAIQRRHDSPARGSADGSGKGTLEYLERNNLFVVPLDNERRWYRYHHLFADLLRQRLHEAQPDLVPILHGRASAWYEQHGLMDEAIAHALSAGDFEWAAHLCEKAADATLMRSEFAAFMGWVEALPDYVVRARPRLCVYHAVTLLLGGRPLDVVEARLKDATAADTAGSVAGEVTVLRGLLAAYRGEIRPSAELSERALELLPEDSMFFRSFVAGYLGLAHLYGGDAAAARSAFAEAARISREVGNLTNTVLAMYHLADLRALQGHLSEAQTLYQEALELAVDRQGRPQPIAGIALVGLGRLLHERNDLEGAARLLLEGIELIKRWGEVGALNGYIGLARVRQAQGDAEGARQAMQAAEQLAIKFDAMQADDIIVAVYQVRLWLAQDDLEAAARWVEERGLERSVGLGDLEREAHGAPLPLLRLFEYLTLARVYVAQSRADEALRLLEPLQRLAEDGGWTTLLIQILTLQALALQARDDVAQAMGPLERALSLAEPGGLVRTFVDEGEPMGELLRQAAARGIAADYVGTLLAALELESETTDQRWTTKLRPSSPAPYPSSSLVEPLSERELQILRLLPTHLSSTEIAEELMISVNTVRSHIKSVYSKLNVHSRADAVQRARELTLL